MLPLARSLKPFLLAFGVIVFLMALVYFTPRILVSQLGENSPWISYIYTYSLGACLYFSSVFWIFKHKKQPARQKEEVFWTLVLSSGFLFTFILHTVWIWFSVSFPFKF